MRLILTFILRVGSLALAFVLLVVLAGAVHAFGCLDRITNATAFTEAKTAFSARYGSISSTKCASPAEIDFIFYGIPIGKEWQTYCVHIVDATVMRVGQFNINKCRGTRYWMVESNLRTPLVGSHFEHLR